MQERSRDLTGRAARGALCPAAGQLATGPGALRVTALPSPRAGGSGQNRCLASYRTAGCACANLWLRVGRRGSRTGARKMRSPLIAAYLLAIGMYAPVASLRQSLPPAQAQTVPQPSQPQTELDRRGTPPPDIHRGIARIIADGVVVRRGAASHQPSGSPATDTQPRQPNDRRTGKPQMPAPVGLLLALALVDSGGAAPHETAHAQ